jgi:predicted nucleic acid-binding protein
MRFWDSSALVPLLVQERTTEAVLALYRDDSDVLTWWGTQVECASALSRLAREAGLSVSNMTASFRRLSGLAKSWHEVEPGEMVRETAHRFLRVHDLRAADALQLAAAFLAAEGHPRTLEIVSLDQRLNTAALLEGFEVIDLDQESTA